MSEVLPDKEIVTGSIPVSALNDHNASLQHHMPAGGRLFDVLSPQSKWSITGMDLISLLHWECNRRPFQLRNLLKS